MQIKKNSELTEAQKKALLIVTDALEGAKAIPVEITLVDQNGRPYDPEAADAGQFAYTVRLKLEGELATLDPATIQVYYLNDYGEPGVHHQLGRRWLPLPGDRPLLPVCGDRPAQG